jgi:sRNA-binding protein
MSYRPTREESEHVIRKLANDYPKCFFEDPKQRQPLKKTILADLEKDGFPAAHELLEAALDWYQSHFAYQYALQAGTSRIDLQGKKVSSVTEQEHRNAKKRIEEDKQRHAAKDIGSSTRTLASLHGAGRIPDDQLKKLDAPPMPVTQKKPVMETPEPAAELARLYEALNAANTTLAAVSDPTLRSAMAAAALGIVVKEAQRVVAGFQDFQEQD